MSEKEDGSEKDLSDVLVSDLSIRFNTAGTHSIETARLFPIEKGFVIVDGATGFSTPTHDRSHVQLLLVELIIPDAQEDNNP